MNTKPIAALIAIALAACAKSDNSNNEIAASELARPTTTEVLPPDDSDAPTVANADAVTPANDTAVAKLPTSIPVQFHGRWGLNKADCTSTKGDAKGLLTINEARLTFYESRGTLDKVLGATANSFDARYAFSGEGQNWARTERLKVVDRKLNRRTDAEPDQEPPINLTYSRC